MATSYEFKGWLGHDAKSADGNMKWGTYKPKKWDEGDVDIEVSHCGICGSDLHTLRSGWSKSSPHHEYPFRSGLRQLDRVSKASIQYNYLALGIVFPG